jgi:hypothetical protein
MYSSGKRRAVKSQRQQFIPKSFLHLFSMPEPPRSKPLKSSKPQKPLLEQRRPRDNRIDRFRLLIECRSEAHQKRLYRQLTKQGLSCRPLVL